MRCQNIFYISMRSQNIFWHQRFVLHDTQYKDRNMSARSTPPWLLVYCWTIWGYGMFFLTFSFPQNLSNSPISSTPTKFDARSTHLDPLHTHFSRIAIITVMYSTFAIFHEIFVCIKRTTSQSVQSACIPFDLKWCKGSNVTNQLSKNTL